MVPIQSGTLPLITIRSSLDIGNYAEYGSGMSHTDTHLLPDGTTTCCGAFSTYHDETECCKVCWEEVTE